MSTRETHPYATFCDVCGRDIVAGRWLEFDSPYDYYTDVCVLCAEKQIEGLVACIEELARRKDAQVTLNVKLAMWIWANVDPEDWPSEVVELANVYGKMFPGLASRRSLPLK